MCSLYLRFPDDLWLHISFMVSIRLDVRLFFKNTLQTHREILKSGRLFFLYFLLWFY